jgi:hypothetical protein
LSETYLTSPPRTCEETQTRMTAINDQLRHGAGAVEFEALKRLRAKYADQVKRDCR